MDHFIHWKRAVPISIRRRNPFQSLQNELDKVMTDFYSPIETGASGGMLENLAIQPSIDIIDEKDTFKVEVEMPGLAEENIKVNVDNGILTIKAEKRKSQKNKDKNYVRREICYGTYETSISLPESVDATNAKASFKKGMLWIVFPKKEETKKRHELKIEKVD